MAQSIAGSVLLRQEEPKHASAGDSPAYLLRPWAMHVGFRRQGGVLLTGVVLNFLRPDSARPVTPDTARTHSLDGLLVFAPKMSGSEAEKQIQQMCDFILAEAREKVRPPRHLLPPESPVFVLYSP